MRLKSVVVTTALLLCLSTLLRSQDGVDLGVVDRIKSEAIGRSRVMDHLRYLTDVHGPRLTGSTQFEDAAKWTTERLTEYGVSNVHIERFPFGRRWSAEQYSCELLAPHYMRLSAMPLAWSDSTNGPISGEPLLAPFELAFARGPKRLAEDFDAYRRRWAGKLRGRIVLFTPAQQTAPRQTPLFKQQTEAELQELARAPEPAAQLTATRLDDLEWPEQPEAVSQAVHGDAGGIARSSHRAIRRAGRRPEQVFARRRRRRCAAGRPARSRGIAGRRSRRFVSSARPAGAPDAGRDRGALQPARASRGAEATGPPPHRREDHGIRH